MRVSRSKSVKLSASWPTFHFCDNFAAPLTRRSSQPGNKKDRTLTGGYSSSSHRFLFRPGGSDYSLFVLIFPLLVQKPKSYVTVLVCHAFKVIDHSWTRNFFNNCDFGIRFSIERP